MFVSLAINAHLKQYMALIFAVSAQLTELKINKYNKNNLDFIFTSIFIKRKLIATNFEYHIVTKLIANFTNSYRIFLSKWAKPY